MTLVQKINALLTAANAKTSAGDASLTEAVQTLIDGYGGGITPPAKGFVPTAWDADGYVTEVDWYGDSVPKYAFYTYSSATNNLISKHLTSIDFKNDISSIGNSAFSSCFELELTSLPGSITSIGSNAFYKCTGLASITFCGKPNSIAADAFNGCTDLRTINVPWAENAVAGAPWGAANATINYNYTPTE